MERKCSAQCHPNVMLGVTKWNAQGHQMERLGSPNVTLGVTKWNAQGHQTLCKGSLNVALGGHHM
jgi:hypothetical protein